MTSPKIIDSPSSRVIKNGSRQIEIRISRPEKENRWSIQIVAGNGCLTVWDKIFSSDEAALDDALEVIEEDGIASFYSVVHYTDTAASSVRNLWGRHTHSNWKH
jgi:hypothetical protein